MRSTQNPRRFPTAQPAPDALNSERGPKSDSSGHLAWHSPRALLFLRAPLICPLVWEPAKLGVPRYAVLSPRTLETGKRLLRNQI